MALDHAIRKRLTQLLSADDRGTPTPRLPDDAARLLDRVRQLIERGVVRPAPSTDALELACLGLQLPQRLPAPPIGVRAGPRECAQQAAELLTTHVGTLVGPQLLDRTVKLIEESANRNPGSDEAKLLADALNLGDFCIDGFLAQALAAGGRGLGVSSFLAAFEKRDSYGYWDARLRDGFCFAETRALALERLARVKEFVRAARLETVGDGPA